VRDLIGAGTVLLDHPRTMLNTLAAELDSGAHDEWFEDAKR
jgi:hypothetical protein